MPFLENVTRGRNVPHDRLLTVSEHYYHFGGRSPLNDQNRQLMPRYARSWKAWSEIADLLGEPELASAPAGCRTQNARRQE